MKNIIVLLLLLITGYGFAQTNWVYDIKVAQTIALQQNKLIIADFWATWCGPCKQMDKKLWNTQEMAALSNKFVFLKINIDQEKALSERFDVTSIPYVVLMDASQEQIWSKRGFSNAKHYLNEFKKIPVATQNFSKSLLPIVKKRNSSLALFNMGLAYQETARTLKNTNMKFAFLKVSDNYFEQIIDKSKNENLVQKALLHRLLSKAYVGKSKKVLKKLEKLTVNEANKELKCFVKAYCYKNQNDKEALIAIKEEINDPEFLSML
ncbi:thioredoxin family protein [Aquimarina sp. SS2-1]|uniref:thioredoxin family protein n=1 Tax=Aquimarina besae TaxID=3342247 RepID=UPI003672BD8D